MDEFLVTWRRWMWWFEFYEF